MNGHYVYPPPGVVFVPPARPSFYVPHAQAQYGAHPTPPGISSNGYYGAYPYPHPHFSPGTRPYGYHPHPAYPYMNPPPHADASGWYHSESQHGQHLPPPAPNQTSAPKHPPGLSINSHLSLNPVQDNAMPASPSDNLQIHEYWRGRLAPLPGYCSKPVLLPMKEIKLPQDNEKTSGKQKEDKVELLLSMSFFGPGYKKESTPSPKIPFKVIKNDEKNDETKKDFQFDKYADSFVPQYLKKIQRELHPLKPLPPIPIFPAAKYLESFLPPRLIEETLKFNTFSLLSAPPIPTDSKVPVLDEVSYRAHWADILRWELDAMALRKEQIVLWKMEVKVAVWKDAEFVFSVPGIRENHPHLEIGDLFHMREVLEAERRGSNRALEGRVVALRKREGLVHISSTPLKEHIQTYIPLTPNTKTEDGFAVFGPEDDIPVKFNISFMMNTRPLCSMEAAVAAVANVLNSKEVGINLARQWIFAKPEDYISAPSQKLRNGEIKESQWIDKGLNGEQRLAVKSVSLYQSPVPHLISGPPGTGKTKTVVEALLQIFHVQSEACILLCAPSNSATDTLVLRLQGHLLQHEMLRLNDPNRTFAEVPDAIKPFCYVENDSFSLPPWKKLMQYRVVVCSCLDASILVRAQCTNTKLMAMEEEIITALHPHRKMKHLPQPHWTHLLIDEAAQGSEPELLIPISVVLPQVYGEKAVGKTFMPQLALCGDINQLGPIVVSEEARSAELEVSLLERLFERPLYSNYTNNMRTMPGVSQRLPPYTHLVKNYRSHPAILMPPSAIFYNDSLEPCAANGKVSWMGLPNPLLPLKFVGNESQEESTDERASWFNPGQITTVVRVVKSLLNDPRASTPPLRHTDIGVMAPWREQVWKLRERLRKEGLGAVDVGTVEDYQGRESRVVIISCVRSNPRFLDEDCKKGLGLIFERKRMNVAITRAKELMVVIGSGSLLQRDPYWKSFLQFAMRNRLYVGPELSLEMDGNYISRLESALVHSGKDALNLDPEEQGTVVAGGVAREVLKE